MSDDRRAGARLMIYAIALAAIGVLITRDVVGLVIGVPVALAAIARGFGIRDLSDLN